MKNTSNTVRTITEVGIIAALGFVFDTLQGIISKGVFVNGGSIGFAMIAVLIIAYRRGVLAALATGLIMGLLDVATGAYIIHPVQLLLDYILPYAVVGVAGFFKPLYDKSNSKGLRVTWLIVGAVVGGLAKFLSHYLAGVIYWANPEDFAWDLNSMNPYLYCFIYNIAFIGPSIVLTGGILVALEFMAPRILTNKPIIKEGKTDKNDYVPSIISIITMAGGAFLFVFFLIKYIQSFADYKDGSAYGYDFDPDSLIVFVVGLSLIVLGALSLFRNIKDKFSYTKFFAGLTMISLTAFIYGLARLIRTYVKNKDHTTYWIWFAITITVTIAVATTLIILFIKERAKIKEEKRKEVSNI